MTVVLVHPGSLYGHQWTSLGTDRAKVVRSFILQEDIGDSKNLVVVLGNGDDLFEGSYLDKQTKGPEVEYLRADPNKGDLEWIAEVGLSTRPEPFLVTGAWANPKTGCVTATAEALREDDREAYVSKHALQLNDWCWDGGEKTQFHEPRGLRDSTWLSNCD